MQGASNKCFPSDAGTYYEARKSGSRARICNTDAELISAVYHAFGKLGFQARLEPPLRGFKTRRGARMARIQA